MVSYTALTDRSAVLWALEKFDRIGREAFLAEYRYRESLDYYLVHEGRHYDTKPVFAAAYKRQHGHAATGVQGGKAAAARRLKELGFVITEPSHPSPRNQRTHRARGAEVAASQSAVCPRCFTVLAVSGACSHCVD
ncbi:hypothetical protein NQ156_01260 [Microbacterium sp. zg.Y625]|uniref:hypothetical protein n=1 Tax=Microbacterium jiangjiandongii TaxID=3049071 RepID=UPI00214C197C|nr:MULTISPECIES: hypothetical protein [unclassified Microbacterium]MCR2791688.1 hypothetical protein [Microbacterium sp. zg.Y625]WIM24506.1 hypothetical protein QNO14_10170 [Microbacterium sp. zg-Y625]